MLDRARRSTTPRAARVLPAAEPARARAVDRRQGRDRARASRGADRGRRPRRGRGRARRCSRRRPTVRSSSPARSTSSAPPARVLVVLTVRFVARRDASSVGSAAHDRSHPRSLQAGCVERGLVGEIIAPPRAQAAEDRRAGAAPARRGDGQARTTPSTTASRSSAISSPSSPGRPLVAMVVEGPDAYKVVRTLMGTTNPREAAPGTIRGDLAIELTENLVHGSDGPESAAREIALFFPGLSGDGLGAARSTTGRTLAAGWRSAARLRSLARSARRRRSDPGVRTLLRRIARPRHGGRPRHREHARLRARPRRRARRAVGRRGERARRSSARGRHRGEEDDRAHARPHHRDPSAEGRRHRRLRHLREDAALLHPARAPAPVGEAAHGHLRAVGHHRRRAARGAGSRASTPARASRRTSSKSRWPPRSAPGSRCTSRPAT